LKNNNNKDNKKNFVYFIGLSRKVSMRKMTVFLHSTHVTETLTSVETTDQVSVKSNGLPGKQEQCSKNMFDNALPIEPASDDNANDDYTKTVFYEAFSHHITALKVVGMFHVRPKEGVTALQVYCWCWTIYYWLVFAAELSTFRVISAINMKLIGLLMCCMLTLLCAVNIVAHLRNGHRPNHVRKFFLGFERLNRFGGTYTSASQARKISMVVTIFCLIIIICNFGMLGYVVFKTRLLIVLFEGFGMSEKNVLMETGMLVLTCLLMVHWIMPNGVELCISSLLFLEYRAFYKAFVSKIDKYGEFEGDLEVERQRYVAMSRIVEAADRILALQHGASFGCNIVNMCLLLYTVTYYRSEAQVIVYVFWFILVSGEMAIKCTCGILVNYAVIMPLQ
jgi:hypothetical protein